MGLPTPSLAQPSKSNLRKPEEGSSLSDVSFNIQFVPGMFSRPPHHLLLLRVSCFSISIPLLLPHPPPFFYQMKLLCKKALAPQKNPKFFLWNIRCVSWLFIFALTKLIYAAWICFVEFQSCHYPQNPYEPTCKGWTLNNSHCVVFAFCFVATTWFLPLNQNPSPTFCRPPTY